MMNLAVCALVEPGGAMKLERLSHAEAQRALRGAGGLVARLSEPLASSAALREKMFSRLNLCDSLLKTFALKDVLFVFLIALDQYPRKSHAPVTRHY